MTRRASINYSVSIALILLGLVMSPVAAYAATEPDAEAGALEAGGDVQEWEFLEDIIDLPAFPDFDKLKKIPIDASFGRFDFFIDPASLKVSVNDIVLATIVMTSDRGSRNILFEAYRCDTREYKTYAYGTSDKTFYEIPDPQWQLSLRSKGTTYDFRRELLSTYLCDSRREALSGKEILRLIEHPQFRDDEGREF